MKRLNLQQYLRFILPLCCFSFAQRPELYDERSGAQYIFYHGNVSGEVSYDTGDDCQNVPFPGYDRTYLYVGIYPWDNNSFFFDFYHVSSSDYYYGHPGRRNRHPRP